MKVLARRFNIYLALAFLLGLACGCQTGKKPLTAALRVHIETSPDPTGTSQNISMLRSDPVLITIKREPILTEANIVLAKVIDNLGDFALEIKFDENGTWLLEQYSAPIQEVISSFGVNGAKSRLTAVGSPHQSSHTVSVTACCHLTLIFLPVRRPINLCSVSTTPRRKSASIC